MENQAVATVFSENPFIKNIKGQFSDFMEKRPEDRVYLHFDKPFYYPGETVWFQAYVRDGAQMKPSGKSEILHVEFINPRGNKEKELHLIARNGSASGDIQLDEGIPGGLYKIRAYTNWQKNDQEPYFFEKEIPVQKIVLPTLKMKLDFLKEAYGPGDEVVAKLDIRSLDDLPLKNKLFRFTVRLKSEKLLEKKGKTDANGEALVKFSLPEALNTADGLLNVLISHQGKTESISRSVPILLNNLQVEFFPEGGDLVEGLTSRVGFRVLNEFGKPADVQGLIIDKKGKTITEFESFHQGMGAFQITSGKNGQYSAKITRPKGISQTFPLPEALPRGYILKADTSYKDIILTIRSTEDEELSVVLQIRGKILHSTAVPVRTGENLLNVPIKDFPVGVARITLFDSKGIERCERLVFVNRDRTLNIDVQTDKKQYLPREKVKMTIRTTDERGMPIPGNLSLAVTDDKIISFADDKSGHILSKLLLEPDLKTSVYEPVFYFDKKEEKSLEALDYLMMTQGWRRFEWKAIMQESDFNPQYNPEKAVIRGVVMDDYHKRKPVKGATVRVVSTGKTCVTDKNGEFIIRDTDLYEPTELRAEQGRKKGSNIFVTDYNTPVTLYLHHYRDKLGMVRERLEKNAAVPMAPMPEGALQMAEMAADKNIRADKEIVKRKALAKKDEMKPGKDRPMPEPKAELEKPSVFADEEIADIIVERKVLREPSPVPPGPVYFRARVFPTPVYEDKKPVEVRTDFRSTIFWKGDIEIDRKGKADIEFYNSDEVTSFRAVVEGIAADGLVGRKEFVYHAQLPFSMSVKIPVEVTMGDELRIPLTLINNTEYKISGQLTLTPPKAWKAVQPTDSTLTVSSGKAKTVFLPYKVMNIPGKDVFKASFTSRSDKDSFTREITVAPKGFPVSIAMSAQEKEKKFKVKIQRAVTGTVQAKLTAYPAILSDMLAGIESILREPYGCFEQTSSSTYPNIMVLEYLKEHGHDDPNVLQKAGKLVDKGYKRLISFETKEKGYEWFGAAPPHEALTAYGLMEFEDMKKIYDGVDNEMTERTAKWLMARRDGKGGFKKNSKALDSFGRASDAITNAYIVYALAEAGLHYEIKKEIELAVKTADKSKDPYQIALVVNALFNIKDKRADSILKTLLKKQNQDGSWQGTEHSVTRSTGLGLKVETTALVILAALKSENKDIMVIDNGVRSIVKSRSSFGGFGNTQSTVLALKALTEYTKFSKRTAEPGTIRVFVGDQKAGETSYKAGEKEAIVIGGLEEFFRDGTFDVSVKYADVKNPLPFTFSLDYSTDLPPGSEEADVSLETTMSASKAKMGETVRLTARLTNLKDDGLPMTLAILGIPGGLSPQPWQLKELTEKKTADSYEVIGNQVVLYFRQMTPLEKKEINLDLKAEIPGKYEGQASRAYLYYTNEHKDWVSGEKIEVMAP
ncbi:MAG: hypothetical protein GY749_30220 [Desulfobacteraceae bacterium]|nr:hypothetical protein [Desulfobacteraceae bacterium]